MSPKEKLTYVPPELEEYFYVVENGFANTPVSSTAQTETFSEINDAGTSSTGGENQTGFWGDSDWS